jgi:hypothetical protein
MHRIILALLLGLVMNLAAFSQQPSLTADDYARAEKFLGYNTNPLVLHSGVRPTWLPDDRFWYRITTERGSEFILVNPANGSRNSAFDHARVAAALSSASGAAYEGYRLPFTTFTFEDGGSSIAFNVANRRWRCDAQGSSCVPAARSNEPSNSILSPDRKRAAFIRDHNLWVRDLTSGAETQLTRDGVPDFGYATNNAGWIRSNDPVLLWSPDSRRIATFQHDGRGVGEMYLLHTAVGRPKLEAWKYPLVGDPKIFEIHRVIIDVEEAQVTRLQMPADPHRSSLCDHIECTGVLADAEWSADGRQLAFISTSRDHKRATLRVADAVSGKVRDVIDEQVATYFEGGSDRAN